MKNKENVIFKKLQGLRVFWNFSLLNDTQNLQYCETFKLLCSYSIAVLDLASRMRVKKFAPDLRPKIFTYPQMCTKFFACMVAH